MVAPDFYLMLISPLNGLRLKINWRNFDRVVQPELLLIVHKVHLYLVRVVLTLCPKTDVIFLQVFITKRGIVSSME
jgi:hypothetical protein